MNADRLLSQAARSWGARSVPFSGQGELFKTPAIERSLALLDQSAALRSVMLLSGENGVGKSALAGRWLRSLEPKAYFGVAITQASLSGVGILALFLQQLGKTPRHQRNLNLKLLEEAFAELGHIIPVLVLDEAQNYAVSALEEIRMLLGLNLAEQPAFALILVGDPYLLSTLRLRSHRALYSRIAAHAQLEKLSRTEIEAYLNHQLRLAGIEADCFEPAAIELLTAASEGIPRAINLIARAAWIEASKENSFRISATHLQSGLERVPGALELRRQSSPSPRP
jgi:type II secretory pathway predicted ATPase ExeA